jgi:hypothetical protein
VSAAFLIPDGAEILMQRRQNKCFHGFPFLKLQDVFDDAVGELAFHGSV